MHHANLPEPRGFSSPIDRIGNRLLRQVEAQLSEPINNPGQGAEQTKENPRDRSQPRARKCPNVLLPRICGNDECSGPCQVPASASSRLPVSGKRSVGALARQRRFPGCCPHQGWRVVKSAPPFLDGDWAVEEKGIKNHFARVTIRREDEDSQGDVIPQ